MERQDDLAENEVNILKLLHVLVKRKLLIIAVCVIAVTASVIYSLTLPNIYSSTARVLPPQKDSGGGLSALLGQVGGLAGLASSGFGGGSDLYIGILKSRSVADAVVEKLNLMKVYKSKTAEDARVRLNGAVKIQAGKDGIIAITVDDTDPRLSASLANTFVQELGKTTVRLNLSNASIEREFLERRLELVKVELAKAEDALKAFSQRNKIVQVDSQAKASIEAISRMRGEIATKEVQLAVLSTNQTEQSPEVKALRSGIDRLKRELQSLTTSGEGSSGIPSVGDVPGVGLEYTRRLREVKTQEAIFEQLTKQYELAKMSEAKDSSSLQIVDQAVVPVHKSKPMRSLIVILTAVIAFFAAIILAFTLEYLDNLPSESKELMQAVKRDLFKLR